MEYIKKLTNNIIIELNDFNNVHKNLKLKLDKLDLISKDDKYGDDDFKNYLSDFQNKSNFFKNNFSIFSNKYNLISEADFEDINMKDFSLPILCNNNYYFNLNDIKEKPNILARP